MSQCAGVWVGSDKLTQQLTAKVHRRAKFFKDTQIMFPFFFFKDERQESGCRVRQCLIILRCNFEKKKNAIK